MSSVCVRVCVHVRAYTQAQFMRVNVNNFQNLTPLSLLRSFCSLSTFLQLCPSSVITNDFLIVSVFFSVPYSISGMTLWILQTLLKFYPHFALQHHFPSYSSLVFWTDTFFFFQTWNVGVAFVFLHLSSDSQILVERKNYQRFLLKM